MNKLTPRQQQIVNASIELIAEKGIQNLTTRNISEKIGISEAAIYRHFKSKLDILLTLLDEFEERFSIVLEKINSCNCNSIEKIGKFFILRCEEFAETPDIAKVIFSEEIFRNEKELSQKIVSIMKKHQSIISQIVKKAQQNGEIRSDLSEKYISFIIMGTLRLIVTRWRLTDFSFDLVKESKEVWKSIEILISKEVKKDET